MVICVGVRHCFIGVGVLDTLDLGKNGMGECRFSIPGEHYKRSGSVVTPLLNYAVLHAVAKQARLSRVHHNAANDYWISLGYRAFA